MHILRSTAAGMFTAAGMLYPVSYSAVSAAIYTGGSQGITVGNAMWSGDVLTASRVGRRTALQERSRRKTSSGLSLMQLTRYGHSNRTTWR